MPVHFDDLEFAAIDFESTGFTGGGTDEPIHVGIAIMRGGTYVPADSLRSFNTPSTPRTISDSAYSVHRIGEQSLQ